MTSGPDDATATFAHHHGIGAAEAAAIRLLFARALPLEHQDDRFDAWPPPGATPEPWTGGRDLVATTATVGDSVVAYVGGTVDADADQNGQSVAHLDAIVDESQPHAAAILAHCIETASRELGAIGVSTMELWARPATATHEQVVDRFAMTPTRALHQMRVPLPVEIAPIDSRAYHAHDDLLAVMTVNNRAFATHPDQGSQTPERMRATMEQRWFQPEGLRIHERDGRVAGFCWTKIHAPRHDLLDPAHTSPPLGEIFVIGVDPDFHGQGLGAPMTAAGLSWLHEQGLEHGMLYVEADNEPAVRTYLRLGFVIERTDKAWTHVIAGAEAS
ncbi:MAG: GNAT family N-acetyltransferase [Actinomycetota bacterium]